MSLKSLFQKNSVKNSLKSIKIIALIGGCSLLCTQFIVATELGTTTKVPTTYNVSELSYLVNRPIPTGYEKAHYKVINSPHAPVVTPHSKDLSLEEAAEIVAQEIFRLSNQSLGNQTIELDYSPQTSQSRSKWWAEVHMTPNYHFNVTLNGSTGELIDIKQAGNPSVDPAFDVNKRPSGKVIDQRFATCDKQIKAHLDDAYMKAKNVITQKGYLSEPIKSISYEGVCGDLYGIVSYIFDVTTTSNHVYTFYITQDLTQLTSYYME